MAKQALAWEDPLPPPGKREAKVVQLLRTGGGAWGVTEAHSAFVYPRSLRPLKRIAGLEVGAGGGDIGADGGDPKGSEVSQLLTAVFPRQLGRGHIDNDTTTNNGSNDNTTTTTANYSNKTATTSTNTNTNTITITKSNDNKLYFNNTLSNNGNANNVLEVEVAGQAAATAPCNNDNNTNRSAAAPRKGATGNTPPIISRCRGTPSPRDKGTGDRGATKFRKVKHGITTARPVFYPYGNGNTAPSSRGVVYGGYMLSHSINPQVLPNRPHTRQVHAGTQRVAARAAARAKDAVIGRTRNAASSSRIGSGRPNCNLSSIAPRRDRNNYFVGGNNGGGNPRRVRVTAGDKEAVIGGGAGGRDGCDHQVFDPVLLFSALPDDPQPWSLAKDRRTSTALSGPSGRQRPSATPDGWDELPPAPSPNAALSPENRNGDQEQASDSGGAMVAAVPHSRSSAQPPSTHAWTLNQRLANDPRNYKFLPRGWASELIVPAGVFGREAPSMESFFPRPGEWMCDGKGVGVARSTAREGADECGVGGCLRWNPAS